MPRYRATIRGKDYDAMADLVRKYRVAIAGHTAKPLARGAYRVHALVTGEEIRTLERAGYQITRHEDVDVEGRKRRAEISKAAPGAAAAAPQVDDATGYLTVAQVEDALAAAAGPPNDGFVERWVLPHATWEGRACHAVRIGHGGGADRPGIYLIGGVHAREWGSPDILVNFVQKLTAAYHAHTGIAIGQNSFSAAQIQSLVNGKDVYVFAQVNPDGRLYSMTADADWRKNRRPAPSGHTKPACVGVDLNRNYDFLWDFKKFFSPQAPIANSVDPCDPEVYIGPSAFSEPETRNVVSIMDTRPNIHYFVDIHSYSEDILYNWGDDVNQVNRPDMNFRNPAFDGKRGIANDTAYKEFMPSADQTAAVKLARVMRDAIKATRGRQYTVMQSLSLYPTAGTSDDYAFSRHLLDPGKPKVYSYTIEWGRETNPTPFHPPYAEMSRIIQEITAALLAFCLKAT
jgi:murein tripeptide amidase MpaA